MRFRLGTAVIAALVLLAGCLTPDAEDPPEADAANDVSTASAGAAGPTGTPSDEAAAGASDGTEPAEPAEPTATTLTWEGSTASALCVMAAQRCQILQEPGASWNEFSTLGVPGHAIRASGTLTWDPVTPATEQLHVFVFSLDETGMPIDSARITGPSPLAFDVDLAEWTGVDFAYSIHGHHDFGNQLIVETSQPFHMETTIVSLVDA